MKIAPRFVAAVAALCCAAPPLFAAQPPSGLASLAEQFRTENERRKRPRFALLWNRTFSDDVATEYTDFMRLEKSADSSSTDQSDSTTTDFGNAEFATRDESSSSRAELTSGARAETPRGRARPPEQLNWTLESAFTATLQAAGARLIDRAIVMRTLNGGRAAGAKADVQSIEAQALLGKADLLLEVLLAQKPEAPAGVTFQVNVKNVNTGELLTSFVSDAIPYTGRGRYRAATYGFEFAAPPAPSASQVGEQLAAETMNRLMTSWENAS